MSDRDRLIELLTDNLPRCGNLPHWDNPLQLSCDEQVERIADHLLANGVIVPPCKVGELIFFVTDGQIYNGNVFSFSVTLDGVWFYAKYANGLTYWHKQEDFGKTVFLTEEGAEQALKEREQGGC